MPHTNILKWLWLILNITLSATILVSTGSAILSISIERDVDLLLRVESIEVSDNLDIRLMVSLVDLVEPPGREETLKSCADTVNSLNFSWMILNREKAGSSLLLLISSFLRILVCHSCGQCFTNCYNQATMKLSPWSDLISSQVAVEVGLGDASSNLRL